MNEIKDMFSYAHTKRAYSLAKTSSSRISLLKVKTKGTFLTNGTFNLNSQTS